MHCSPEQQFTKTAGMSSPLFPSGSKKEPHFGQEDDEITILYLEVNSNS